MSEEEKDPKEQLKEIIENYLKFIEKQGLVEKEHVKIEIIVTPGEIKQCGWNVTFTALDETGAQILEQFRGER